MTGIKRSRVRGGQEYKGARLKAKDEIYFSGEKYMKDNRAAS